MEQLKLYMLLLGCRVKGRHTEQHDIFIGVADSIKSLVPTINKFWPEAKGRLHIDAWREITKVDGYKIEVLPKDTIDTGDDNLKLYFLNLGGYKQNEFEEFHYRLITVGTSVLDVSKRAKQTMFYKHTGLESAPAHIDDKYGIDVDDAYEVKDILPKGIKAEYKIVIKVCDSKEVNEMNLGYFKLDSF